MDQIIGDDAEADPALHAGLALVATAVQAVPSFQKTDASFATGAPFLGVAEPTFFLQGLAFDALGGAVGNRDPFDAPGVRDALILCREECGGWSVKPRNSPRKWPLASSAPKACSSR
jgi:hypothetical protein